MTLYLGNVEIRKWGQGNAEEILLYPVPQVRIALTKDAGGAVVTKVSTLHRDALGSVRAVTNAAGLKAERSLFRPFGEEASTRFDLATSVETKGFIGQRYDADAGLQYLNARYYDPKLALFVQPDWFGVKRAGTNRYGYCLGDPVNCSDTTGNVPDNWTTKSKPVAYDSSGWRYERVERTYGRHYDRGTYKSWNDRNHPDREVHLKSGKNSPFSFADNYHGSMEGTVGRLERDSGSRYGTKTTAKYEPSSHAMARSQALGSGDAIFDIATLGGTAVARLGVRAIVKTVGQAAETSFFSGTRYTQKVVQQMRGGAGEFHSFPEAVTAFERSGTVSRITGGDGVIREMLEIPGSYATQSGDVRNGVFQSIKEVDGMINHR